MKKKLICLLLALILALSMAPSAIGGPVEARLHSGTSLRIALVLLLASSFGTLVVMNLGLYLPFLLLVALFGVSVGMCLSGSLRLLFSQTDGIGTATITSSVNLVAYIVCTICSFVTSALIPMTGLMGILALLIVASLISATFVFLKTRSTRN